MSLGSKQGKPSTAMSSMTMTPTAIPDDDPTPPLTFPADAGGTAEASGAEPSQPASAHGGPTADMTSIKADSMHTYIKHGQTQMAAASAGLAAAGVGFAGAAAGSTTGPNVMQPSAVKDDDPTAPLPLEPLSVPQDGQQPPANNIPPQADPRNMSSVEAHSLPGQARGRAHVPPDQPTVQPSPAPSQAVDDQSTPQFSGNGAAGGVPQTGREYAVLPGLQRVTGEQGTGQQGEGQDRQDKQESEQNIAHGGPGLHLSSADARSTHADSAYGQSHHRLPPTGDVTSAGADSMHALRPQACPDDDPTPPKEFPDQKQEKKDKEEITVKEGTVPKVGETVEHTGTTSGGGDDAGAKETQMESLVS